MADMVNHPPHYAELNPEPIDVIEGWELGFHLGNALKYIARAGRKDGALTDLKKARWYLDRMIESAEADVDIPDSEFTGVVWGIPRRRIVSVRHDDEDNGDAA